MSALDDSTVPEDLRAQLHAAAGVYGDSWPTPLTTRVQLAHAFYNGGVFVLTALLGALGDEHERAGQERTEVRRVRLRWADGATAEVDVPVHGAKKGVGTHAPVRVLDVRSVWSVQR